MAITILITKDPGIKGGFLDSAAALTVAVEEAQSKHDITLVALIYKDVKKCVPILQALGYEIRSYDVCIFSYYICIIIYSFFIFVWHARVLMRYAANILA